MYFLPRLTIAPISASPLICGSLSLGLVLLLQVILVAVFMFCKMKVTTDTYLRVPMWRSILSQHTYFSIFIPCHYKCAWIHTLRALVHMSFSTFMYQLIFSKLLPKSLQFAVYAGLMAGTVSQVSKPSVNVCFNYFRYDRQLTEEEVKQQRLKDLAKEEEGRIKERLQRRSSFFAQQTAAAQGAFAEQVLSASGTKLKKRAISFRFSAFQKDDREDIERQEALDAATQQKLDEENAKIEAARQVELAAQRERDIVSVLQLELDITFPNQLEIEARNNSPVCSVTKQPPSIFADMRSWEMFPITDSYVKVQGEEFTVDISFPGETSEFIDVNNNAHIMSPLAPSMNELLEGETVVENAFDIAFPGEAAEYHSFFIKEGKIKDVPTWADSEPSMHAVDSEDDAFVDLAFPGEAPEFCSISFRKNQPAASSRVASPSKYAIRDVEALHRPSHSFRRVSHNRNEFFMDNEDNEDAKTSEEVGEADSWSWASKKAGGAADGSLRSADSAPLAETGGYSSSTPTDKIRHAATSNDKTLLVGHISHIDQHSKDEGHYSAVHIGNSASSAGGDSGSDIGSGDKLRRNSSFKARASVKLRKEPIITYHLLFGIFFVIVVVVLFSLSARLFSCKHNYFLDGWIAMVITDILFMDSAFLLFVWVYRKLVIDEGKGTNRTVSCTHTMGWSDTMWKTAIFRKPSSNS